MQRCYKLPTNILTYVTSHVLIEFMLGLLILAYSAIQPLVKLHSRNLGFGLWSGWKESGMENGYVIWKCQWQEPVLLRQSLSLSIVGSCVIIGRY